MNYLKKIKTAINDRIWRPISRSIRAQAGVINDRLFPQKDPEIFAATLKLRARIINLPFIDFNTTSRANYKWLKYREQVRKLILTRDPSRFLNWETIRSTMSLIPNPSELEYLKNLKDWNLWQTAILKSSIGSTARTKLVASISGDSIHHAYSLARLLNTFGVNIEEFKSIFEIGGGYGDMCLVIYKRGFKGTYKIFDLPEFLGLQEFFLSLVTPDVFTSKVTLLEDKEVLSRTINEKIDLVIATWSVSEMSKTDRDILLGSARQPRFFLIAFQKKFGEVDNTEYFQRFTKCRPEYEWKQEEIAHLPGNYHLFGKLK